MRELPPSRSWPPGCPISASRVTSRSAIPAHRRHACRYGHLATGLQWKLTGKDGDHWLQVPWKLCTNNAEIRRRATFQ